VLHALVIAWLGAHRSSSPAIPPRPALTVPADPLPDVQPAARPPATQAAPAATTAEAWAFAGRHALKNNKAYRYTWGWQVRSMMGAAVEGTDQGLVRFRVEIAPDGPQALADCLEQLPPDSIEAEMAQDRRLMERRGWGSNKLGP
jgi:hypothetical protein